MQNTRINTVHNGSEPKSIKDIQVFLRFTNFYWQFTPGFSQKAILLISLLRITNSPKANTSISADSIDRVGGSKLIINDSNNISGIEFVTSGANYAYVKLRQAFSTAQILYYFD